MTIKSKVIIITAAAVALSAGFWLSTLQNNNENHADKTSAEALDEARRKFSPIQGVILSPARKIVIPPLSKDDGKIFSLDDLKGGWHFLFFGYTNCPDICPVTMGVVAQAKKNAAAMEHEFPGVIFISVDPDRDKLQMLAEYVQYFDKDFIGVTGSKDLIKALTLQMSVVYMQMPAVESSDKLAKEVSQNYVVDHSSALLLINPQGKLVAFFNPPHDPATILKDFQTVLKNSQ